MSAGSKCWHNIGVSLIYGMKNIVRSSVVFLAISSILAVLSFVLPNGVPKPKLEPTYLVVNGSMPAKPLETRDGITLVYGIGDSLMQASGIPGKEMQSPQVIAVIPKMFSFAMRGPQAVLTSTGVVTIVCTQSGDIFCYKEDRNHHWRRTAQLNTPGTAKEGLISLAGSGDKLVAVWLNAQAEKGQSIYSAISSDGGESWKSKEIYTSPDGTTCECCKPNVVMKDNTVYVMFRNWINGNRDMHIMNSTDGGLVFSTAEKVGTGNWRLKGCPMDGGDIQIDNNNQPTTIWRREGRLYSAVGIGNETALGDGKNGSLAVTKSGNAYAWTDNGMVVVQTQDRQIHRLGEGTLPILATLNNGSLLCIWQQSGKILGSLITSG
jgi:hypothetical protein